MVVATAELAAAVAWSLAAGEVFTWARAAERRRDSAGVGNIEAAAQRAVNSGSVVHPYFGYVMDMSSPLANGLPASPWGFCLDAPPLRPKAADRYVIGLIGGSFDFQVGAHAGSELARFLERSPRLAGRRVEIVNLAVGGFKQPQQLLVVQVMLMLGGHFDCIVNIDGFNEVALAEENIVTNTPAWFPRGWARLLDAVPTREQQRRIGDLVVLDEQRAEWQSRAEAWWWSPTAQFLWLFADRRLADRTAALRREVERAPVGSSFAATGPGAGSRSVAAARTEMIGVW
jgi:hypothetical protein